MKVHRRHKVAAELAKAREDAARAIRSREDAAQYLAGQAVTQPGDS